MPSWTVARPLTAVRERLTAALGVALVDSMLIGVDEDRVGGGSGEAEGEMEEAMNLEGAALELDSIPVGLEMQGP